LNVSGKKDLTMSLNGKALNQFSFDTKTGVLRTELDISKGRNVVVVTASNTDGVVSETVNIDF